MLFGKYIQLKREQKWFVVDYLQHPQHAECYFQNLLNNEPHPPPPPHKKQRLYGKAISINNKEMYHTKWNTMWTTVDCNHENALLQHHNYTAKMLISIAVYERMYIVRIYQDIYLGHI